MRESSRKTAARGLNETALKNGRSRRFPYLLCNHISLAVCLPYLLCNCSSLALCLRAFFRSSAKHAGSRISQDCVSKGPRAHEIERQYPPRLPQRTANRTKAGSGRAGCAQTRTRKHRPTTRKDSAGHTRTVSDAPQGPGPSVPPSSPAAALRRAPSPAAPRPPPQAARTRRSPAPAARADGHGRSHPRSGTADPPPPLSPPRRTQRRVRAGQARPAPSPCGALPAPAQGGAGGGDRLRAV